jgi:hypothetical protein
LARQRSKPIAELAKDLRISESCLRNWVAQAVSCGVTTSPALPYTAIDLAHPNQQSGRRETPGGQAVRAISGTTA